MACPLCGEHCTCSDALSRTAPEFSTSAVLDTLAGSNTGLNTFASRVPYRASETMEAVDAQAQQWRDEVSSRVQNYRRRRGRGSAAEYSLHLDFNAASTASAAQTALAQVIAERAVDPEVSCDINYFRRTNAAPAPVYEPEPKIYTPEPEFDPDFEMSCEPAPEMPEPEPPPSVATPEAAGIPVEPEQVSLDEARWGFGPETAEEVDPESGNVIVFPTQPTYQVPTVQYELGEPVLERPRILDVPEDVLPSIQGSLFANIQLDTDSDDALPSNHSAIDVPLQVAMINQRVFGGIIDAAMVLCGFGAFAAVFFYMVSNVVYTKPVIAVACAIPAVFWMIYQYIFLTYGGHTLGMLMAHLSLVTFEGSEPNQRRRRQRAISMIVSLISGGVGFGWAFLDPDTLCWHDSISRTYLTPER